MKTNRSTTLSFAFALLLNIPAITCFSSEDPDLLLQLYLETGSLDYAVQIRDGYPESAYERFCDAWEYLDGNNEKAREVATALVQDHPDFAPGAFVLGTVLLKGFKEYDEAIGQFDRSLEINPEFMWSYLNRGIARIGSGEYQEAKEDFNQVMKLKRGYALGYLLRGVAEYGLGDEEAMKADFEIGLQLDFMAISRVPGGLADEAMDKAIEAAPENAIYYYARGYSSFRKENYRAAASDFTKCIELVPGSSDFYKYSAASKMHLDDFEGAQKDLNYALSVNPDDPEIYYYLGVLMNDFLRQAPMAREYLNHALELDAGKASFFYERSKASYKMLNYEDARDDINRALQLDYRQGDFYAMRGNIKMKLDNPSDDYCPDFRKAIEWGTSYNLKRVMKKSCK